MVTSCRLDHALIIVLSSQYLTLTQAPSKDEDVSASSGSAERLPLLADLVLYYCRHANKPVLVQLYQAEVKESHKQEETVSLNRCSD